MNPLLPPSTVERLEHYLRNRLPTVAGSVPLTTDQSQRLAACLSLQPDALDLIAFDIPRASDLREDDWRLFCEILPIPPAAPSGGGPTLQALFDRQSVGTPDGREPRD